MTEVDGTADGGATQLGRRGRTEDAAPLPADGTLPGRRRPDPETATDAQDVLPEVAARTQLGRRGRTEDAAPPPTDGTLPGRRGHPDPDAETDDQGGAPERADRTHLGRRAASTEPDADGLVRFGPGVPRAPAESPEWSSARPGPPAARRRRRRPWIGALITIALVAGVLAYLLTRGGDPIQAHAQQVTARSPSGACDTVVDVIGTITTNGRPGSVTYQWIRNDGQPTSVLSQTVPSGTTTTQVHLQWSFSGHGRFDARAVLRVIDPSPASEATGTFTYSCS